MPAAVYQRGGDLVTNKEWLNRGWKLIEEVNSLEKARDKRIKVRGEKKTEKYTKLIDKKVRELIVVQIEIVRAINRLTDRKDRMILQLRYLAYLSHEQIAEIMAYDETRSVGRRIDAAAERIVQR